MKIELLAPAGQPDSAYAALHYGADALYLGLAHFSARADATNFTPAELAELVAYAHSLTPRRRIYLTLNTVVKQRELPDAAQTLLTAADAGVDAVIVQDLGVLRLARDRFPGLTLHASTQMAIHDLEGCLAAKRLGFQRVTLARELTLEEIRRIAREAGIEVETFIHGTLCYAYSGLCLFSSIAGGRSGNRGRCAYTCREAVDTPAGPVHPFSLKDMALGARVRELADAGVASLKIEGRKKSPLYVAATVDYYRRLLDGAVTPEEAKETEARLKTVFARPWTTLFLDGRSNPAAADPEVVGHRGSRIGQVERRIATPAGPGIAFTPSLPVERHDGLQIDIPGASRPYGFPVDNLYAVRGKRLASTFAAAAGETLAVTLPPDAPGLTPGLPLYLASSQAVKRSYPFDRPRPGAFGVRRELAVRVSLRRSAGGEGDGENCRIVCRAATPPPDCLRGFRTPEADGDWSFALEEDAPAFPARDLQGAEQAARDAFSRLGDGEFRLGDWRFDNPDNLFVQPRHWNRVRRLAAAGLARVCAEKMAAARRELAALADPSGVASGSAPEATPPRDFVWTLAADHPDHLAALTPEDFAAAGEVAVGIGESRTDSWRRALDRIVRQAGMEKIRFALPLLFRHHPDIAMADIERLRHEGGERWLVPGLGGWQRLAGLDGLDLAADWPLYTLNGFTVRELAAMGFSSCTLSPEDDADNLRILLARFGDRAEVVAYSRLPLFLSAACAHAHIRHCRKGNAGPGTACPEAGKSMAVRLERSGGAEIAPMACGSVVTGPAYGLIDKLPDLRKMGAQRLRVDLRWRRWRPEAAAAIWRGARAGTLTGLVIANFERGLL